MYVLKEEFESFASTPHRVDACESIAKCFYQLEQYEDAANWYETAGRMILSEPAGTSATKALSALSQYEMALDCFSRNDDDERFTECSIMISQLKKACASA